MKIFIAAGFFAAATACQEPLESTKAEMSHSPSPEVLIEEDRKFSALSDEKGMKEAFLFYMAEDGVLLRPNSRPVAGKENIRKLYSTTGEEQYKLLWEPLFADIAASGEMGYTYGTYTVYTFNKDSVLGDGTYLSNWKKNEQGEWKVVIDTGNEGLLPVDTTK